MLEDGGLDIWEVPERPSHVPDYYVWDFALRRWQPVKYAMVTGHEEEDRQTCYAIWTVCATFGEPCGREGDELILKFENEIFTAVCRNAEWGKIISNGEIVYAAEVQRDGTYKEMVYKGDSNALWVRDFRYVFELAMIQRG